MIEHLNARRMIAIIVLLIFLCIIIVILEETITDADRPTPYFVNHQSNDLHHDSEADISNHNNQSITRNVDKTKIHPLIHPKIDHDNDHNSNDSIDDNCLNNENEYETKISCTICNEYERKNSVKYCLKSGFKKQIYCKTTPKRMIWIECFEFKSLFYMFEFFMLLMSVVFIFYVQKRQSMMNRLILNRIEKQLSSGV